MEGVAALREETGPRGLPDVGPAPRVVSPHP